MSVNGTSEERLSPSRKTEEKHSGDKDTRRTVSLPDGNRSSPGSM